MNSLLGFQSANGRCLKRSFTSVTTSNPPSPERATVPRTVTVQARRPRQRGNNSVLSLEDQEARSIRESMPTTAGPRIYESQIPSSMSVYVMDSSIIESPGVDPPSKEAAQTPLYLSQNILQHPGQDKAPLNPHLHSHQHRESTSTQASDSTESSPTTTISTVDSSSLSDPSPSSSPESPITLMPLSSFSGSTFGLDSFHALKMADSNSMRVAMSEERPMTSPSPRRKNPKSLALNLNFGSESSQPSEPSSPSFIKPPTLTGRKKPSLLSLNTGAANKPSLVLNGLGSPGLPSMLQRRGLKHSISSPQILSTPGFGPGGGMNFGERNNPPRLIGVSRLNSSSLGANTFTIDEGELESPAVGPQMATRVPGVSVGGDSFDRPQSGEDAVSASYPDGPILMHEPNVHLYLEPKLEEALKFDVIINVAREVKNPFKELESKELKQDRDQKDIPSTASSDSKTIIPGSDDAPPDTAVSLMSFQTAFEVQPSGSTESSPTTPKPASESKLPEYIHIPWDHNTDVKDELWDLCQLIDSRVKDGKRVLVHCQQGASRSATLIIAYGMYLNPELQATEAHKLAQAKSPWVNPNMSLLFSLNDFKKIIEEKRKVEKNDNWKPQTKHRPTLSADTLEAPPLARARGNSTPSSTARENALSILEDRKQCTSVSDVTIRRLASFDFGFGEPLQSAKVSKKEKIHHIDLSNSKTLELHQPSDNDWGDILSPRVAEMTGESLHESFARSFSSQSVEEPQTPALFSPRGFEFPRTSFFSALQNPLPVDDDPRSPPIHHEAPITRSIDDFL